MVLDNMLVSEVAVVVPMPPIPPPLTPIKAEDFPCTIASEAEIPLVPALRLAQRRPTQDVFVVLVNVLVAVVVVGAAFVDVLVVPTELVRTLCVEDVAAPWVEEVAPPTPTSPSTIAEVVPCPTPTEAKTPDVPTSTEAHNRPMHCVVVVIAVVVLDKADVVLSVVASDVLEVVTVTELESKLFDTETQRTPVQPEVVVPSAVGVNIVVSGSLVVLDLKPVFTLIAPFQPARSDAAL